MPGVLDLPMVVGERLDPCWRDGANKPIVDPLLVCVEIPWDEFHPAIKAYWSVMKAEGWESIEVYDDFFGYTFRRFTDETTCQELHISSITRGVPGVKKSKTDVLQFRARPPEGCRRRPKTDRPN